MRDGKPEVPLPAQCSGCRGPDASGCPTRAGKCPRAPRSRAWRLGPGGGRDGGPSGPSSFLEFWPCCHSDDGLRPGPPHPRFPLLLKILCFQQEGGGTTSDAWDRRAPVPGPHHLAGLQISWGGAADGVPHLQPLTHSSPPAQRGPRPGCPHRLQGFASPRLSKSGRPPL